ncbi:hypothetical protein ACFQ7A_31535 [Streptomyces sp. NPDC056528]|uniref:hypothetical protein n=1 Tax=Streptomyces sp. NPDC056528 TaxID=3345854 RepID=UPI0036C779B6
MTQGWKVTVIVLAAVGIASTPLVWLLNGPGAGQLVGASVQAAVGAAALAWALLQRPTVDGPEDAAIDTGEAKRGGNTGVKRPGGRGKGSAKAKKTGDATGNKANSGIDYSS